MHKDEILGRIKFACLKDNGGSSLSLNSAPEYEAYRIALYYRRLGKDEIAEKAEDLAVAIADSLPGY